MTATWTQPRTWSVGELTTAALMNQQMRDNLDWLKTPLESGRIQFASDFTTTSGSYVDITSVTTTLTTNGGGLDVYFRANVLNSAGGQTHFQIVIDGAASGFLDWHYNGSTTIASVYQIFEHVAAISGGSHTIKIQCKTGALGGTTTIRGTTAGTGDPLFYVVERGS